MTVHRPQWLMAALLALAWAGPAWGNVPDPQILLVPFAPNNPQVPHPAHGAAHVSLKGMLRNAACASGYDVAWDVNRNGNYDDDTSRRVTPAGGTVRDIGRTFVVPAVPRDQSTNINVRVTNRCSGQSQFATYRLFTYAWTPAGDPRQWTAEQVEVMGQMSVQEVLWYLHRRMGSFAGAGSTIRGTVAAGGNSTAGNPLTMWVMALNGHQPAYPPGTFNPLGVQLPDGWLQANDERWATTPYAEDQIRMLNWTLNRGTGWQTVWRNSATHNDEDNTCGFNPDGSERRCNRIDAADRRGMYSNGVSNNPYYQSVTLGGLAPLTAALAGTPLQTGGAARGMRYEVFIQELTDWLGAQQFDGGCGDGSWYYRAYNSAGSCGLADASAAQWAYIGLESAEVSGRNFGVIVNNQHKYRIANNLVRNQGNRGGSNYRNAGSLPNNLQLTGGAFVASRWLGIHTMSANSNRDIFGRYSDFTEGQLRQAFDRYLSFTAGAWTSRGGGWNYSSAFWIGSDYLCANTNAVYRWGTRAECGNLYAIYSHQKGYRTTGPDGVEQANFGGRDWNREFSVYAMRSQHRNINDYDNFGLISDCGYAPSATCRYGSNSFSGPSGGLVLTPTLFNPKPVAVADATPLRVVEGCLGGNAGRVDFTHDESFHPAPAKSIVAYQWDVDASNGLWWDTGAAPDFETDGLNTVFEHRYQRAGAYAATLRVVDSSGQTKTATIQIQVEASANVPPAVASGGPYALEEGQALQLRSNPTDQNLACGDRLTVAWDLDDDGQFDDAVGATPIVGWAALAGLRRGAANPNVVRVRAVDQAGQAVVEETTLTIYPREPVAAGRANPNPAACRAEVSFDASASAHPNPQRSIAQYDWDVDGDGNNDGSGQVFRFAYPQFGTYQVTLTVTDDLGRTDQAEFEVAVDQGNQPPVARVARNAITVLEGDALVLDGRPSSEPNANCGDAIARYAWDLNGDGDFDDPQDIANAANPTVAWDALLAAGLRLADPATGAPTNRVTLRVTDGFGVSATAPVTVTLLEALPEVRVVQNPDPASVRLDNGLLQVSLDGRESRSPVPGVRIVRFDWDLDDDGAFETADRPVVNFQRVVPAGERQPNRLPTYAVRLRVTDESGRQNVGRYVVNLTVPPTPPTADADPSDPPELGYDILVGEALTLDGSQSSDPDSAQAGDYLQLFQWDLDYDEGVGFQADVTQRAANAQEQQNAARVRLTWQELVAAGIDRPGTYAIRLRVEDITNLTNEDTAVLRVHAVDPVAQAEANPNPAACNGRVTLDGRGSNHPHPTIDVVGYSWDFDGDGQADAAGAVVQQAFDRFTFGQPNPVTLSITDSRGNQGSVVVPVTVDQGNRPPVANAGGFRDPNGQVAGPYVILAGEGLALDAAGSAEPDAACGDAIQSYAWDVGANGSIEANGARADLTWAQLNAAGVNGPGRYDVRLTVVDRFGAQGTGLATLRVVQGPQAVAQANPARTGCGAQVRYSAEQSRFFGPVEQGFGIVRYAWDLDGDGQFDDAEGPVVERPAVAQPDENGQVRAVARLRVTDGLGNQDTAEVVVVIDVQNQAPVANAGGPYSTGPVAGGFADVTLDGRGSVDPNAPCDAVVSYRWDTDNDGRYGRDDNPADLEGAAVRYNNPSWQVNTAQTVRLVVCDAAGACSDPAEAQIEVLDVAPPEGEIVSPRADAADTCLGGDAETVELRISDPAGNRVTATVFAAGVEVGQASVDPPDDGSAVPLNIVIDARNVPEGRQPLVVRLRNSQGGEAEISAGGRLTFDRTAPQVVIGNNLGEGVCYNANGVPEAVVQTNDALDPAPAINREVIEDACGRTLRVTATDACGNEGVAQRSYLLAQPVQVALDGVAEGALVADARITWAVQGPDSCASAISAEYVRNGGAAVDYPEGQLLNQPGTYALTVSVANCAGVARDQIRNFSINAPPTAVAIPAGYPAADPNLPNAYLADEGAGLQLDGSASLAPEAGDAVVAYRWNFDAVGPFEAEGEVVAFDTSDDGVFEGFLEVADALGATGRTNFRVTIRDVHPAPDAGGPYTVAQGTPLRFDGRATQPGSAADPISRYTWDFGDGTPPVAGADLTQPEHTYTANGAYTVTLRVDDEDSFREVQVAVNVQDVDPIIDGIEVPEDPYETAEMTFRVAARAGAPGDPLTRIEWDIDGDGQVDYAGPGLTEITHQFETAGTYNVVVTVRDGDSSSVDAVRVDVREITLAELLAWIDARIDADLAPEADTPGFARFQLQPARAALDRGLWGEANAERGVTWMALRTVVRQLVLAQGAGADYGWELWALSRQLKREVDRQKARILADEAQPRDEGHPSVQLATDHIDSVAAIFEDPNFRGDVNAEDRANVVNDLFFEAVEAYYWLEDTTYQCNEFGDFELPDLGDPRAVRPVANRINTEDLRPALTSLRGELLAYAAKDGAPGADQIAAAAEKMAFILDLQGLLLGPNCEENERCVTDREALDLELEAARLVRDLDVAANGGVWVRQWQSCMVLALKFRIELSIQRVEFACGANSAVSQRARQVQAIGLDFVETDRDAEALSYYAHPDRQCTLVQVYDECLVDADPDNAPYDGDLECLNELVCREVAPTVTGGLCPVGGAADCEWPEPVGRAMTLVAQVRNASSGPCEPTDLSLEQVAAPAGWQVEVEPAEAVPAGEAGAVAITVTWPEGTAPGLYRVDMRTRQGNDPTLSREIAFSVRVP